MKKYCLLPLVLLTSNCANYFESNQVIPTTPPTPSVVTEEFGLEDFNFERGLITPTESLFGRSIYSFPQQTYRFNNVENDTARNYSNADRFIVVNIPAQTLRVFENGEEILRSKVIVGKPSTRTPTQRSRITSLKLNPDWHAPAGGNIEKTYTAMIRNGEEQKLRDINIDWYRRPNGSYQFYQRPGETNVLGRIKFEMFSPSNTYLHDTNRPDLFNLEERFISFGCIRVDKWDELAAWMLGWDTTQLLSYLDENKSTEIKYIDEVEIHIVYWTHEILVGQEVYWPDIYNKN